MGAEILEKLKPNDPYYSLVVEKIRERSKNRKNVSPYYVLAEEFGREASGGLKEIDRSITINIGEEEEPLFPNSDLYEELSNLERRKFMINYSAVWASSALETWDDAIKTGTFDFEVLRTIFNERIRGTRVAELNKTNIRQFPIDRNAVQNILRADETRAEFLSDKGLYLVPPLRYLMSKRDALSMVQGVIAPSYFALALAFKPKLKALESSRLSQKQIDASLAVWHSMWDKTKSE